MRKVIAGTLVTLGLVLLSAGAARADPRLLSLLAKHSAYGVGVFNGQATGRGLSFTRLNPVVRFTPVLNSSTHPAVVGTSAATTAQGHAGRALRAYMVGNVSLGEARMTRAAHATGLSHGLTGHALTTPLP